MSATRSSRMDLLLACCYSNQRGLFPGLIAFDHLQRVSCALRTFFNWLRWRCLLLIVNGERVYSICSVDAQLKFSSLRRTGIEKSERCWKLFAEHCHDTTLSYKASVNKCIRIKLFILEKRESSKDRFLLHIDWWHFRICLMRKEVKENICQSNERRISHLPTTFSVFSMS